MSLKDYVLATDEEYEMIARTNVKKALENYKNRKYFNIQFSGSLDRDATLAEMKRIADADDVYAFEHYVQYLPERYLGGTIQATICKKKPKTDYKWPVFSILFGMWVLYVLTQLLSYLVYNILMEMLVSFTK